MSYCSILKTNKSPSVLLLDSFAENYGEILDFTLTKNSDLKDYFKVAHDVYSKHAKIRIKYRNYLFNIYKNQNDGENVLENFKFEREAIKKQTNESVKEIVKEKSKTCLIL